MDFAYSADIWDGMRPYYQHSLITATDGGNVSDRSLKLNYYLHSSFPGRGNSTVVSASVYHAGDPGSRQARSTCHRKVEFYHCVIHSLPPVPTTGSTKAIDMLLCLCNNSCKSSLAICRKSRVCVPLAGFCLSLYDLHALNRDVNMIQTNKQNNRN